ncbi:MAG: UDP-glucose 4-epimerase, partial [Actinotalea sp.]|nr:UDP-glucose 4-epimerase [Actinotalea sp.]
MSPTGTPTVAVTGGLGAIGGEVVRWLVAAGVRPVVLDVHEGRSLVRAPVEAYEVVHADIRDEASLDAALAATGADVVVHLAAKIRQDAADPRAMVDLNVTGALHALESARRAGVARFVLMSSRAAYGSFTGPHGAPSFEPVPEEYRCAPAGLYGATKLLVEHVAASYPAQGGPEVIVTRLAWTFGPGKVGNHGVYGIYSEMVEGALAGRSVSI